MKVILYLISSDGASYYGTSAHALGGYELHWQQALVPEHLARAAPKE